MVGWECPTNPREASGLDPEAVHGRHVLEYGIKCWQISVDVRNQTDPHTQLFASRLETASIGPVLDGPS